MKEVVSALVPFVRLFYGQASEYNLWDMWDADGARHGICQGEGCEQGDTLAPAPFALGQHDRLQQANTALREGESFMAFLGDLCLALPNPARAREATDVVTGCVEAHAGTAANRGKTRVFNFAGGPAPLRVTELGPDVWRGDKPLAERGFVALGTPVGTAEYTQTWGTDRFEIEEALLRQLLRMLDLQCAWLLRFFDARQSCAPYNSPALHAAI